MGRNFWGALALSFFLVLTSCGGDDSSSGSPGAPGGNPPTGNEPTLQETQDALREHIAVLASDEYAGRLPGTEGGRKTQDYLVAQLQSYGLVGGIGSGSTASFRQEVPLKSLEPVNLQLIIGGTQVAGPDGYIVRAPQGTVSLAGRPLIAIDTASDIPANMSGQIAVVLANSNYQSYYLTALNRGADAAVVIFDDSALFATIEFAVGRTQVRLDNGSSFSSSNLIFLGPSSTEAFFSAAGTNRVAFGNANGSIGMGDLTTETRFFRSTSNNIVGRLPGTDASSGAAMIMGHWDHLGDCGRPTNADRICNGAVDNASGIASMLETVRRVAAEPRQARDIYFFATTAEESGLLGAIWFVNNPPMPLVSLQGVLNLDTVAISAANQPFGVVGWGLTPLDPLLTNAASANGRTISPGSETDLYLRRQDGFVFLNAGVPAVLMSSAFGDEAGLDAYFGSRYHRANDELSSIVLAGAASDIPVFVDVLLGLANPTTFNRSASIELDDNVQHAEDGHDPLLHVH